MQPFVVRSLPLVIVGALFSLIGSHPASADGTPTCAGLPATLVGTARADKLVGTSGDDVIVGLARNDVIDGRGGDDVICGGRGADTLFGRSGTDELQGGGSRIVRGDGQVIYYRDRLVGGAGDDVLDPGFDGGTHETRWDLLDFSGAPGPVVADVAADTVTGHGVDIVVGDNYAVLGSRFDDTLTGGDGDDELYGGNGADQLLGLQGADTLLDTDGSFRPTTTADDDLLDGGPGDDLLFAEEGNDDLFGGDGADSLSSSGAFPDRLDGGPGRDEIYDQLTLSDDQSIDAGGGRDLVRLFGGYDDGAAQLRSRVVIDLAAGTARIPASDLTFPFAGAEALMSYLPALTWYGTDGADKVEADPTYDRRTRRLVAHGRAGDDRITGTTRADLIDGGPGVDVGQGRTGDDTCIDVEVRRSC